MGGWPAPFAVALASQDLTTGYDSGTPDGKPSLHVDSTAQMVTLTFADGSVCTLRGSGTEPKLKYYVEVRPPAPLYLRGPSPLFRVDAGPPEACATSILAIRSSMPSVMWIPRECLQPRAPGRWHARREGPHKGLVDGVQGRVSIHQAGGCASLCTPLTGPEYSQGQGQAWSAGLLLLWFLASTATQPLSCHSYP